MKPYTLSVYVGKDIYNKLNTIGEALELTPNQLMGSIIRDSDTFNEILLMLSQVANAYKKERTQDEV